MANDVKIKPGNNFILENYIGLVFNPDQQQNDKAAPSNKNISDPIRLYNNRFWNKKKYNKNEDYMPVVFNHVYGDKKFYNAILDASTKENKTALQTMIETHWKGSLPSELNSAVVSGNPNTSEMRILYETIATLGEMNVFEDPNDSNWFGKVRLYNSEHVDWSISKQVLTKMFDETGMTAFSLNNFFTIFKNLPKALDLKPQPGTNFYISKQFADYDFQYRPYASGDIEGVLKRNFIVNPWYYEYNDCEAAFKEVDEGQIKFHYRQEKGNALFMPTSKFVAADAKKCIYKNLKNGLTIATSPETLKLGDKTLGAIQNLHSDPTYTGYRPGMFNQVSFDLDFGGYGPDSSGLWPGYLSHVLSSEQSNNQWEKYKIDTLRHTLQYLSIADKVSGDPNIPPMTSTRYVGEYGGELIYPIVLGESYYDYQVASLLKKPNAGYSFDSNENFLYHKNAYDILNSNVPLTSWETQWPNVAKKYPNQGEYNNVWRSYQQVVEGDLARHEIVAYKIIKSKIGRASELNNSGEYGYNEKDVIEEIYIFPDKLQSDPITYIDTQIKYEEEYVYDLYAVMLIWGTEYRYEDVDYAIPEFYSEKWTEGSLLHLPFYWGTLPMAANENGPLHQLAMSSGFNDKWPKFPLDLKLPDPDAVKFLNWWTSVGDKIRTNFKNYIIVTYKQANGGMLPEQGFQGDFIFKAKIKAKPSLRIYEAPLITRDNLEKAICIQEPPLPPEMEIVPYRGVSDKMLFLFQPGMGDYIKLVTEDEKDSNHWKNSKASLQNKQLKEYQTYFNSSEKIEEYRLYRMEQKPKYYSEFPKEPHKIINPFAASLVEEMQPNKKYYYIATAKSVHGVESFPSPVYSIEIIDDGGVVFPLVEVLPEILSPIDEKEARRCEDSFINFRKKLRITPALLQSAPNISKGQYPGLGFENEDTLNEKSDKNSQDATGADPIKHHNIRPDFKFRITSNKTQRKVDLNILFRKQTIWPLKNPIEDAEVLLSWNATQKIKQSLMVKMTNEKAAAINAEVAAGKKCLASSDCLSGLCGKIKNNVIDTNIDCSDPNSDCTCQGMAFGN